MYFYPWGCRGIENIYHHQSSKEFFDGPNGIPPGNRINLSPWQKDDITHRLASQVQPMILCHDQEPLNFELYLPNSDNMNHYCNLYNQQWGLIISERVKNLNLRACNPAALQHKWILLHSELNSAQLRCYESTDSFVGAYWWCHAIIARDWYRYAEYDNSICQDDTYSKLFLTYCRDTTGSREYRKDFLQQVEQAKLADQCLFQSLFDKKSSTESSAIYNTDDINSTAISVVLETVFDQRIHLTEKTLRPIACGQPFILAAGPGSLKLLKDYGFKTFDPFIDESYDNIQNDQERLNAVVAAMKKIEQLSSFDRQQVLTCCREIAEFNRKHFFSQTFFDQIINELYTNVFQAYGSHNNHLDFESWWQERKWQRLKNIKNMRIFDNSSGFNSKLVGAYRKFRS
jgi:hypothetical protein